MGKGVLCQIFSLYKTYFGTNNGTLLRATSIHRKLSVDGIDNGTTFVKTNSGKTSTFHMIQDGRRYYVSETNDSISLKTDSQTTFRVKSITRCNPFVSIQSTKSGRYMTTDEEGRLKMQDVEDASKNLKAWFKIEPAINTTDEVDGHPPHGLDLDNNNDDSSCFLPKQKSETFDKADSSMKDNKSSLSWVLFLLNVCGYMFNTLRDCLSRSKST